MYVKIRNPRPAGCCDEQDSTVKGTKNLISANDLHSRFRWAIENFSGCVTRSRLQKIRIRPVLQIVFSIHTALLLQDGHVEATAINGHVRRMSSNQFQRGPAVSGRVHLSGLETFGPPEFSSFALHDGWVLCELPPRQFSD